MILHVTQSCEFRVFVGYTSRPKFIYFRSKGSHQQFVIKEVKRSHRRMLALKPLRLKNALQVDATNYIKSRTENEDKAVFCTGGYKIILNTDGLDH